MKLEKINIILVIILTIFLIIGIPPIIDWDLSEILPSEEKIHIIIEPDYISEGQYPEGRSIKVIIPNIAKNNITYLKLYKNNVKVARLNKNKDTKVSELYWDGGSSYDKPLVIDYEISGFSKDNLTASGELQGCPNCFEGEYSPYQFTFIIDYKIGGSDIIITTKPIKVKLPII